MCKTGIPQYILVCTEYFVNYKGKENVKERGREQERESKREG